MPNAIRRPKTPIWQSIAAALRDDLSEGRYCTGDKLPTEAQLSARFGVNRHTVRHALAALAEEGIVHPRRGSGVFVTATPTEYPIGRRVRFHRNLQAAGKVPGKRFLNIETRVASATEAAELGLETGATVYASEGLSLADAAPIALFHSVFPGWLDPGFPVALAQASSVTAALRQVGIADYIRARTTLTARAASSVQALHLRLREGAPLILSTAVNTALEGRPVEFGQTWFVGERVSLNIPGSE